jgi:hypothetical protein
MLPATKTHIVGMLNIVRQCCLSIESAMAADEHTQPRRSAGPKSLDDLPLDEDRYCTEAEEDLVAKLMGLVPEEPVKKPGKTKAKESVNGN